MRSCLLVAILLVAAVRPACAASLTVTFITQYCNETIQTADLSGQPKMLRNIEGSLMTAAPSYLDEAVYLQRRTNENLCPDLIGIGETSQQWLRADRVSVSTPAVVIAAAPDTFFPGAAALLTSLGWTPLGDTIRLGYNQGPLNIPLFAGLIPSGAVNILGSGVTQLRSGGDEAQASLYFFFQDASALPPDVVASLHAVSVPEPGTSALVAIGIATMLGWQFRRRSI